MKNKIDVKLNILLIILTLLLIIGFVLCYFTCKNAYSVYAEEPAFEIKAEPIQEFIPTTESIIVIDDEEVALIEEPSYVIDVTDEDIALMARVVMSESSILNFDAKVAVACTIINRVKSDYKEFAYQNTVYDVVNYPNAFSTADNGEVTYECYMAVMHALNNENIFPEDMYWFCSGFTPKWGKYYTTIDGMTFNTINNNNI